MNYLLMICGDETTAEHADDGCGGWSEEMEARGVLRGGAGLRPPSDATTLRVRGDEVLLSDGPFAETKEQIGGFCLIECADLDEAIEIAAKHPAAAYGTIEIRPIWQP
ncbi:transcription initiation protein [Solihabitans fulvus]|uniref:Transcription initiation protein n=1 Tax=Solihabitans fulvus TaxID=1892852 RepID=A0A5B2WY07_9PSEU|nr:YciI family protein [Solihabitans fulvus]KAA2255958.1 transcription initiation protein [Solihabitans fulvus]